LVRAGRRQWPGGADSWRRDGTNRIPRGVDGGERLVRAGRGQDVRSPGGVMALLAE
jgi:hypothetical protein